MHLDDSLARWAELSLNPMPTSFSWNRGIVVIIVALV